MVSGQRTASGSWRDEAKGNSMQPDEIICWVVAS
jgi:hypothetical protein